MSVNKGNIYITSCSVKGNRVQQGPEERVYSDLSAAQFEDARIRLGCDIAMSAYQAAREKKLSDIEILNLTNKCSVIGATFKYEGKDFKVNVYKNKTDSGSTISRTQIVPVLAGPDEPHIEIEFKGTRIADMIETSIDLYLGEILS